VNQFPSEIETSDETFVVEPAKSNFQNVSRTASVINPTCALTFPSLYLSFFNNFKSSAVGMSAAGLPFRRIGYDNGHRLGGTLLKRAV
jgi:hypothetical protein